MKKVLIANRGEIAVRIIRACSDYGLKSVAVYADADIDAIFVGLADEAYALQGQSPTDTYLNIEKLLQIAKDSGADAVHPGYGFLAERSEFARAVVEAGLTWIGPSADVIDRLGDKVEARSIAQAVGAPLVAGSPGPVSDPHEILAFGENYGYPLAIKAAFGGGGRGLKVAHKAQEVVELFHSAVREATAAFGRGECYVEQFLDRPRHVEAQILGDSHGNVVVVGTRDCSMQRRNQKLIEEAPAPFLTEEQNKRIYEAASAICSHAGYVGVGTVEFLLGANGVISFLEVNTRLQVEHPVTEETAGIDLVVEQFRMSEGKTVPELKTMVPSCHSIEFRINAEDVARGFLPTPGLITSFSPPSGPGIRLDSGVMSGSSIAPMFDSMMAKLIVTGKTRDQALARARRALKEFNIEGVASTLPFFEKVINHEDFTAINGFKVHTRWIETDFANELEMMPRPESASDNLQRCNIEIDGKRVTLGLPQSFFDLFGSTAQSGNSQLVKDTLAVGAVQAPVSGSIRIWNVQTGDQVLEGDILGLMEAMKMETNIVAPISGKITLSVEQGSIQNMDNIIAHIEA